MRYHPQMRGVSPAHIRTLGRSSATSVGNTAAALGCVGVGRQYVSLLGLMDGLVLRNYSKMAHPCEMLFPTLNRPYCRLCASCIEQSVSGNREDHPELAAIMGGSGLPRWRISAVSCAFVWYDLVSGRFH